MLPKSEVIIFDMMGVIFEEGDDTNNLLVPFIKRKCKFRNDALLKKRYLSASMGRITATDFWKGICDDYTALEKEYLESQFSLDPHFINAAKKLKKKYDLAILSNDVSHWSKYLRRKYRLDNLFKEVVVSGDYGFRKPDVRLYKVLLDRLNASPADCICVDDNLKNLKQGAELGMTTVHFKRQFVKGNFEANYTVKSFQELLKLLEYGT